MTLRDPYTGAPKAPRPPRPFAQRWWPVLLIAGIAAVAGFAEWQNSHRKHSPAPATSTTASAPTANAAKPLLPAPGAATDEIAAATLALTTATDQLDRMSELLMGIAALQVIVLAGQLYLLGRQRRAGPEERV
ncbi:MAG TPA: hypothetical protein VGP48_15355 [Stellaceae bacterium]|jgi:hypothetical protein|nr:hypothetical protein [Stellaceae bacterium]